MVIKHCDISSLKDTRELCYSKQLDFIFSVSKMNMSFLKTIFHDPPLMGVALDSSGCCFNHLVFFSSPHAAVTPTPCLWLFLSALTALTITPMSCSLRKLCLCSVSCGRLPLRVFHRCGRYCAAVFPLDYINLNGFNQ